MVGHEEKMSTVPITRLRILSKSLRELQHAIIIQVINQKTMGITRNPDHFIRDYHRPSVNIETVILYFQTVNGIINRSHSYYKNLDTGLRQLQTVIGTFDD